MSYRLVSLDIAGTTFDDGSTVYDTLSSVVSNAAGTEVPQELLGQWTGTSKLQSIHGLLAALHSDADPAMVYRDFTVRLDRLYRKHPPLPFAGVTELFERLRERGVKVALQTGYARPITNLLLEAAGWRVGHELDAVVTSDEVPASRPAPFMIFRTMEQTGIDDVRDVLVAGDTPNDLGAGTRAGAKFVVGVLSGAHGVDDLGRVTHTHILPNVLAIEQL